MTSRLVCLLGIDWKDFDSAEAGRCVHFQDLVTRVAGAENGKLLEHPIKDLPERRIYLFPGPSACLVAALQMHRSLLEDSFHAALGLHTGECLERDGRLLGSPLLEVLELASLGEPGELAISEVFRLTLPLEAKAGWRRQDEPRLLAGTPWTVFLRTPEGEA
jgi:class 3 adenylate cyclase